MNSVRSLGKALISGKMNDLWIYIVATTLGALIAGVYWKWQTKP